MNVNNRAHSIDLFGTIQAISQFNGDEKWFNRYSLRLLFLCFFVCFDYTLYAASLALTEILLIKKLINRKFQQDRARYIGWMHFIWRKIQVECAQSTPVIKFLFARLRPYHRTTIVKRLNYICHKSKFAWVMWISTIWHNLASQPQPAYCLLCAAQIHRYTNQMGYSKNIISKKKNWSQI